MSLGDINKCTNNEGSFLLSLIDSYRTMFDYINNVEVENKIYYFTDIPC